MMTSACSTRRVRLLASAGTERPRDRRRNPAAHRTRRDHLHQHHAGKHERHAGQGISPEHGNEPGLDQSGRCLGKHDQHVRPGHPQQRAQDRRMQQHARSRVEVGSGELRQVRRGSIRGCRLARRRNAHHAFLGAVRAPKLLRRITPYGEQQSLYKLSDVHWSSSGVPRMTTPKPYLLRVWALFLGARRARRRA